MDCRWFRLLCGGVVVLWAGVELRGDEPLSGGAPAAAAVPKLPLTYSGRTFEEWQRAILDLEPETRLKAYPAIVAFARNGYEKEAVALIGAAVDREESIEGYRKGYEAADALGKAGEPLLIQGLERGSTERDSVILGVLNRPGSAPPEDALVDALLKRVKNKGALYSVRNQACRALGVRVMAQALLPAAADGTRKHNPAIETQVKRIVPVLEEQLRDMNPRVSNAAAVALMRFSIREPKLMATVLDYLDSEMANPRPVPVIPGVADQSSTAGTMQQVPIQRMMPDGTVAVSYRTVMQPATPATELLTELWNFHRQPDSRDTLQQSVKHLTSLRDKYAGRDNYLWMIVAELEGRPVPDASAYYANGLPKRIDHFRKVAPVPVEAAPVRVAPMPVKVLPKEKIPVDDKGGDPNKKPL